MRRSGSASRSAPGQRDAVVLAEPDVDQRDVGRERLDERAALGGRAGGADDVATLAAEEQLEPLAQRLVVFDEDETERHDRVCIGSRTRTLSARHSANTAKTPSASQPRPRRGREARGLRWAAVAKDTEKLIRQLSLIAYLMAERRPVTATEIRRDVEGYSDMTEDAFARRFYADRAELDSLGIHLSVDRPADGFSEQENYSLAPEAFFLPGDRVHRRRARRAADRAEPARRRVRLRRAAAARAPAAHLGPPEPARLARAARDRARHHRLGRRRASCPRGWPRSTRRSTGASGSSSSTSRCRRGETALRKVDPYELLFEGGQFYLVGYSHERGGDARVPALAHPRQGRLRDQGRARLPAPRRTSTRARYANRIPWQLGEPRDTAEIWVSDRIAWHVERNFGRYGTLDATPTTAGASSARRTRSPGCVLAWAIGYEQHARVLGPPELADELHRRLDRVAELHRGEPGVSVAAGRAAARTPSAEREPPPRPREAGGDPAGALRAPGHARLRADPGRAAPASGCASSDVCEQLQISPQELREDVSVLNVVNFGGGAYVLYAEVLADGRDRGRSGALLGHVRPPGAAAADRGAGAAGGDRAARRAPLRGPRHRQARSSSARSATSPSEGLLVSNARTRRRDRPPRRRGDRGAPADRARVLRAERGPLLDPRRGAVRADQRPRGLVRGHVRSREGRHAPLPARPDQARRRAATRPTSRAPTSTRSPTSRAGRAPGEVGGSRIAHVWISPEQARWAREERTVLAELDDGAVIVEWAFKGERYLVKEILKEAGDAAVLEPADVREEVLAAAERLLAPSRGERQRRREGDRPGRRVGHAALPDHPGHLASRSCPSTTSR